MQTMPFVFLLSLDQISEQAFPAPFKYTLRGDSVCNLHMGVGFKSRKTMTHTRFGMFEVSCQSVRRVMSATTSFCREEMLSEKKISPRARCYLQAVGPAAPRWSE